MKALAIAVASTLAAFTPSAFAEGPERYDPQWDNYYQRPGDPWQNPGYEYRYRDERLRDWRDDRAREERWRAERGGYRYECWNPRARHFESVREGERQDDLDFSRCRSGR
jgi:hypothetical protein